MSQLINLASAIVNGATEIIGKGREINFFWLGFHGHIWKKKPNLFQSELVNIINAGEDNRKVDATSVSDKVELRIKKVR